MAALDRLPPWAQTVREIVEETITEWSADQTGLRAAAISYYFLITLAPLTLVMLWMLSGLLGTVDPDDLAEAAGVVAPGADAVSQVIAIARSYAEQVGSAGPLIAGGIALVGATVLLAQFTNALDVVWESRPDAGGWRYVLRTRLLALAGLFVIMSAVLVGGLAVAALTVGLELTRDLLGTEFVVPRSLDVALGLSWIVALAAVTLLLSFAFTWLPRRRIRWRDTLLGAFITACAYMVGQEALSRYLSGSAVVSAFGATGTIVALVVWIYYTMQVVLFGAELTRVLVLRVEEQR